MLIENFFSVAEKQELSFKIAHNVPDLPAFTTSRALPKERLPVILGFFGPNASGKSTVLRAVTSVVAFVRDSFSLPVDGTIPFFQPYMRKDWWNKPSKIAIEFECQLSQEETTQSIFRYELHIAHTEKTSGKCVEFESLHYAPKGKFKRLFERNRQSFTFSKEFELSESDVRIQSIRPNASIISTLAQLNHTISTFLLNILQGMQTNIHGSDKVSSHATAWLPFYQMNPDYLENLNKELRRLDVGLEEMIIESTSHGPFAKFKHIGLDAFIHINEESVGTRKFIEIFPKLHYVLATGGVAIIDELDTDLHPFLIPELFRWFCDSNRNPDKAQLFFTAHNPSLLDEMEKEQVFLTEKASGKPTTVYGVRDIKGVRREPSLMKKYLAGELGAVPYIG